MLELTPSRKPCSAVRCPRLYVWAPFVVNLNIHVLVLLSITTLLYELFKHLGDHPPS